MTTAEELVRIEACRACNAAELAPVLNLGRLPLVNSLIPESKSANPELLVPLEVVRCLNCALIQITVTVPPETLFREYSYFSSFSDTMLTHVESLVSRLATERELGENSLVVEVASNDGYLLQYYKQRGIPVLGIEPAENVAQVARSQRGIPTVSEFFGYDVAKKLRDQGKQADVLHANNVLAHVPDLRSFLTGVEHLLTDRGVAVIEVPYLRDFIDHAEFDTIYHEHLFYFSATALQAVFEQNGLSLVDIERVPIHGGSLRLFAQKATSGKPGPRTLELLREEAAWGVRDAQVYQRFHERVLAMRETSRAFLREIKSKGKRIAAYGASAKGTVMLNYFGIGPDLIDMVVDKSPHKQGRLVPGARIPIRPVSELTEQMPDYTVILVWNLLDEVLRQQAEYQRRGGKFVVLVPEPRIL